MKLAKRSFVENLSTGDSVDDLFVITTASARNYAKGKFLTLRLADRTGKVDGILWDATDESESDLRPGTLVHVRGKVGRYQGTLQVTVQGYEVVTDRSSVDPRDFLPAAETDAEELAEDLVEIGRGLENPYLKQVWEGFFADGEFLARFKTAPAGKRWHHAYVGGLIEHTRNVISICEYLAGLYPDVDRDLLLTAALFHDVGKVDELSADLSFDYTDEGRLVGHLFLGLTRLERLIEAVPDFPGTVSRPLLHAVLAHHGETENSPMAPMTREALLLHHADNIDAHMNAFAREMAQIERPEEAWTDYVRLINRYLYRGPVGGN